MLRGLSAAREAVARFESTPEAPLTEKDVIIVSGCSAAIEMAMRVLADPGDNILIPNPGFSLYRTIAGAEGFETRFYRLLPDRGWEADLEHLESQIDKRTRFILVNNPSNPCGSVYSKEHLLQLIGIAERHRLPIISDEIYAYSVFKNETFYPIASLTTTVPVLALGAISKRFLVPGWRVGWILVHDRNDAFKDVRIYSDLSMFFALLLKMVRSGLADSATKILGPCAIIQGALPSILANTPKSFFDETMRYIEKNAEICYLNLSMVPGLKPVKPRGAMYMMASNIPMLDTPLTLSVFITKEVVGIDESLMKHVKDELDFTQRLVSAKSVFCLPGSCFGYANFFRIVLTPPEEMLRKACERIGQFCREILGPDAQNGCPKHIEILLGLPQAISVLIAMTV
eukprot:gene1117-15457_t